MPRIRVITDSGSDLPDALARQYGITIVPAHLRWGPESYLERVNISAEETAARLRAGRIPEVEAPSIEELARAYRAARDSCDGIISIHGSSRLSEAFQNAAIARESFSPMGHGGPFPVAVVDSQSATMGLGWLVLKVARAASGGMELPRLVGLATRLSSVCHMAFFTEHTGVLLKSGQAGRLAQQADNLASLRPLFHLDEGNVTVYERTRTRPKARDALYNFCEDFPKIGELAVFHTPGIQNDVEHLMTRIGAIYPRERVLIYQPAPSTATWLGADAMGVAVLEGDE